MSGLKDRFQLLFIAVLSVSACGVAGSSTERGDPFAFRNIERIVSQPRSEGEMDDLQGVVNIYDGGLRTFRAMYGDGVGPAKRTRAFSNCLSTFNDVSRITLEGVRNGAVDDAGLAADLLHCHRAAEEWQRAGEMATFGKDTRQLAAGGLVVVAYSLLYVDDTDEHRIHVNKQLNLLRTSRASDEHLSGT